MSGRRKYYWDSCVFIAWVTNERRAPGEMEGIEDLVRQADRSEILIMTSVITRIEMLDTKLTPAQRHQFESVLKRPAIQSIACDQRIATRAHELRAHYDELGIKLRVPDCIHLATAIQYEADGLHTFDSGLTRLTGDVAGHRVAVSAPFSNQPNMLTALPTPKPGRSISLSGVPKPARK